MLRRSHRWVSGFNGSAVRSASTLRYHDTDRDPGASGSSANQKPFHKWVSTSTMSLPRSLFEDVFLSDGRFRSQVVVFRAHLNLIFAGDLVRRQTLRHGLALSVSDGREAGNPIK